MLPRVTNFLELQDRMALVRAKYPMAVLMVLCTKQGYFVDVLPKKDIHATPLARGGTATDLEEAINRALGKVLL